MISLFYSHKFPAVRPSFIRLPSQLATFSLLSSIASENSRDRANLCSSRQLTTVQTSWPTTQLSSWELQHVSRVTQRSQASLGFRISNSTFQSSRRIEHKFLVRLCDTQRYHSYCSSSGHSKDSEEEAPSHSSANFANQTLTPLPFSSPRANDDGVPAVNTKLKDSIEGTKLSKDIYVLVFTCTKCDHRSAKKFSKVRHAKDNAQIYCSINVICPRSSHSVEH